MYILFFFRDANVDDTISCEQEAPRVEYCVQAGGSGGIFGESQTSDNAESPQSVHSINGFVSKAQRGRDAHAR